MKSSSLTISRIVMPLLPYSLQVWWFCSFLHRCFSTHVASSSLKLMYVLCHLHHQVGQTNRLSQCYISNVLTKKWMLNFRIESMAFIFTTANLIILNMIPTCIWWFFKYVCVSIEQQKSHAPEKCLVLLPLNKKKKKREKKTMVLILALYCIIPVSEWKIYSGSDFRGDSSSNNLDMRTPVVFTTAIHVSEVTEFLF